MQHVAKGEVAVLLLAGGQGTSGKTLYQLQAERIVKLQSLAKERTGLSGIVPWWVELS